MSVLSAQQRAARLAAAQKLDLIIVALTLAFLVIALVGIPGPNDWLYVAVVVYLMAASHAVVLLRQIGRAWPPIFSGRAIGLAGVAYWFLFETVQRAGEYDLFDAGHVLYGLVLVQIYTLAFLASYDLLVRRRRREVDLVARLIPQPRRAFTLTMAVLVGGLLGLGPIIVYGGGDFDAIIEGILASRSGSVGWGRQNLGDQRSLVLSLTYFGWAASGLAILPILRLSGRWFFRAAVAVVPLAIGALLFFSGSRQTFAVIALPILGVLYLGAPARHRRTMTILLGGGLLVLYAAFQVQQYARTRGFRRIEEERMIRELTRPRGHQHFIEVLYVTSIVPAQIPYSSPGSTFFHVLINPIPRALWPGKPIDPFWRQYAYFRAGSDVITGGTTVAASHIGQLYAEGGFVMVIVCGLLFGWCAAFADTLLLRHGGRPELLYLAAVTMTLMLLSYRGINAGLLYVFPATVLLLVGLRLIDIILGSRFDLGPAWFGDAAAPTPPPTRFQAPHAAPPPPGVPPAPSAAPPWRLAGR